MNILNFFSGARNIQNAPSPVDFDGDLAFAGMVISINQRDFEAWRDEFEYIDLDIELNSRDAWLKDLPKRHIARVNWLTSTHNHLTMANERAMHRQRPASMS